MMEKTKANKRSVNGSILPFLERSSLNTPGSTPKPVKKVCLDGIVNNSTSNLNDSPEMCLGTISETASTNKSSTTNDDFQATDEIVHLNNQNMDDNSQSVPPTVHRESTVTRTEGILNDSPELDRKDMGTFLNHPLTDHDRFLLLTSAWQPPLSFTFPTHREQGKTRKFQNQWLQNYPWLIYSKSCDGGFCKYCFVFCKGERATSLVNQPLKSFNKATDKLKAHDKSDHHKKAVTKSDNFLKIMAGKRATIQEKVNNALAERVAKNRQKLSSIVKTIILCGRQNIALRGHIEGDQTSEEPTNQGNFKALLNFRVEAGDQVLGAHIVDSNQNAMYTSPKIQNELISVIGKNIQEHILEEVKRSKFFSILADEVTDISNKEQLSIVLRYVDSKNQIQEHFVDFIECRDGITGQALAETIMKSICDLGLDPNNIRGQGYDGASNMSGPVKGAAARIQKDHPSALYLHCASHQLNLCIVKSSHVQHVRNMMGTMEKVWLFFEGHPKRQVKLEEAIIETAPKASHLKLKNMCRTRWVQRLDALETFTELLPSIISCFQSISEAGTSNWSKDSLGDAEMLLLAITQVYFPIALVISRHILSYIRGITVNLQAQALDIVRASQEVQTVQATLQNVRTQIDSYHDRWYEEAVNICNVQNIEIALPRRCGRQLHRDNVTSDSPKEYYRRSLTIPFLDHLIQELESRFTTLHRSALQGMSLVPAAMVKAQDAGTHIKKLLEVYQADLPAPLSAESETDCWMYKWSNDSDAENIPKTVTEALHHASLYPNVRALLVILAVLPVTTCTSERSHSGLKRIKTCLRSSMTNDRLTSLTLMHLHREIHVDIDTVINTFARLHPRRMQLVDILS